MNQAYVDGSHQGEVGGWGVVLLVPGQPAAYHSGQASVPDNGACELLAALEAVRRAPAGQPLTLHSDATCVVQAVRRGSAHPLQDELGARIRALAGERGLTVRVLHTPRTARLLQDAHTLATHARLGESPWLPDPQEVRVKVSRLGPDQHLRLRFVRGGESQQVEVELPAEPDVPPALLALRALLGHARPGERLRVRLASALAPVLWDVPELVAHPAARGVLAQARALAAAQGIEVEFTPWTDDH